jgi:hypothetical protein
MTSVWPDLSLEEQGGHMVWILEGLIPYFPVHLVSGTILCMLDTKRLMLVHATGINSNLRDYSLLPVGRYW